MDWNYDGLDNTFKPPFKPFVPILCYMYGCFACTCVCEPYVCLVALEDRKGS